MRSKLSFVLGAMILAAAVLSVLPTAQAQSKSQLTITMNAPTESVKPLQTPLTFSGSTSFTGDPGQFSNIVGIPITYTVSKSPAWASVVVSPASDVIPVPTTPGATITATRPFQVIVTATEQAPAFTADQIEITVNQAATTGMTGASAKNAVPVTADYFSIIDVQLAESIKVERPQTAVVFPLKISNFGNANTKVQFEVTSQAEGFQVVVPNPYTLQSKQAGGNQISADVPLQIQTPYKNGYMNEVGVVNYKLTSSYALNPKIIGDSSSVSVLITTRGFYVPGPSPILFLGLIGVMALALRRFR